MKRKAAHTPNLILRRERLLKGWSQQYVTEKIGAPSSYYVSRWERGLISPSPYYRKELCQLFGKSAHELGLIATNAPSEGTDAPVAAVAAAPPARQSAFWNVPYPRNPQFTGREQVLLDIHAAFQRTQAENQPSIQALSGLGGVGKTQIALEYAYRFRAEYTAVLWMQAETAEVLLSDCISAARLLELSVENGQEERSQEKLKLWLNDQASCLLVLDNVADLTVIQGLLTSTNNCHVLLTTRLQATRQLATRIEIDPLSLKEGTHFLLLRAGHTQLSMTWETGSIDYQMARAITRLVDGLPLALDQAGAYIEETGCSFADYLDYYKRYRAALLARRGEGIMGHPHPVSTTFLLIFETLQQQHPAAAQLLRLCSFLYPDAIPEELFRAGATLLPGPLQRAAGDSLAFEAVLQALRASSLIRRNTETKTLAIHRLVQTVVKDSLPEDEQLLWANAAVNITSSIIPEPDEYKTWTQFQRFFPQTQTCAALIQQWNIVSREAAQLLDYTATYAWMSGQWHLVENFLQQALTVLTRLHGKEHAKVAKCLNNLGVFYQYQKAYNRAEEYLQQAVAIREQVCGAEHLDLAESLDNLAYCYIVYGDYADAEAPAQRALSIRRKQLGATHAEVARSLHTLGRLYLLHHENYAEAEHFFNEALAIREQHMDSSPHLVAQTLAELANLHLKQRHFVESEALFIRALRIYEQTVGNEHPAVSIVLRNYSELQAERKKEQI